MSYKLKYGDILTLPISDETGLIQKNLNSFHLEDFTLFIKVKPNKKEMVSKKKKQESKASCVFGRPGQHFGLFFGTNDNHYKFCWFDLHPDTNEVIYSDIISKPVTTLSSYHTITVQHIAVKREFLLYVDDILQGRQTYNELVDYNNTPIFIGVANPSKEAAPYQEFFSGEFELFMIKNKVTRSRLIDKDTLVAFDFDSSNTTYYSIYDVSNNGNRARINHHTYSHL
jgi:hypothetical protein